MSALNGQRPLALAAQEYKPVSSAIEFPVDDDWMKSPHLVLRCQPPTKVYVDAAGDIVIKQRDQFGEDPTIYIVPESLPRIIAALQAIVTK